MDGASGRHHYLREEFAEYRGAAIKEIGADLVLFNFSDLYKSRSSHRLLSDSSPLLSAC